MTEAQSFAACYRHTGRPFVRGIGCELYDDEGTRFLDLGAGVAVSALGHGHPALVASIRNQAEKLIHSSNLYDTPAKREAASKIAQHTGLDRVFLANSGAEANEAAFKISRRYHQVVRGEKRYRFVCAEKSFHGRTFAALSATGQPKYWEGFEPLVPGFDFVPYGSVEALEEAVGPETTAIFIEPLQGEGGVVVPPEGYLEAAREIADRKGCLLIFDEIQTGVGRTGHFLACQGAGVMPDILTLAKGIAGGLPLGAMVHTEELAEALPPGTHASTFGGNPVACAAACTVMDIVGHPDFLADVRAKSSYLKSALRDAVGDLDWVDDIRGEGLLVGVALNQPAKPYVSRLFESGVLTTVAGGNVLRLSPPLVITKEELDEGVDHVTLALSKSAQEG
jgi:predicted acetylornithine/succinylornithine family transaminase